MTTLLPVAIPENVMTAEEYAEIVAETEALEKLLITEDDAPVDNVFSEKQQRLLVEPLHSTPDVLGERHFVAMANVGLFRQLPGSAIVPDVLVSVNVQLHEDVWKKGHRSYLIWRYGKSPEVVIEIVSNTIGEELGEKLHEFADIPVPYYVVFDPEKQLGRTSLHIFELGGTSYIPRHDPWLPRLGLGLTLWRGQYEDMTSTWLRWCYEDGTLVPTGAERADAEQQRADAEQQRADAEQQRAERLAAQLRALGIAPEE